MIPKATVESIVETARIDEVVGDFVNLRKRGSTLVGLCSFHNESSPSFAVSPSKGIYKCFGCGKAGDSVNFVMEHEHYTYPEALRYLANKYNIEIVEEIKTDGQKIADLEKESLYAINDFAAKFYHQNLETTEGQAIGKAYFYERGFFTLQALLPAAHHEMAAFISLIVVNCITLGRAEAFASKNPVLLSIADAIGMGVGFTLALVLIGSVREVLGNGTYLGFPVFGAGFEPWVVMILPPGGFLVLGVLLLGLAKLAEVRARAAARAQGEVGR